MTLVLPINKKQGPIYLLKDRYPDVQDFKTGKIKGLWMPWQKGNYMGSDTSLQCTQDLLLSGDPNNPYYAPYSSFGVDDFSLKYWPKTWHPLIFPQICRLTLFARSIPPKNGDSTILIKYYSAIKQLEEYFIELNRTKLPNVFFYFDGYYDALSDEGAQFLGNQFVNSFNILSALLPPLNGSNTTVIKFGIPQINDSYNYGKKVEYDYYTKPFFIGDMLNIVIGANESYNNKFTALDENGDFSEYLYLYGANDIPGVDEGSFPGPAYSYLIELYKGLYPRLNEAKTHVYFPGDGSGSGEGYASAYEKFKAGLFSDLGDLGVKDYGEINADNMVEVIKNDIIDHFKLKI